VEYKRDSDSDRGEDNSTDENNGVTGEGDSVMAESTFLLSFMETWQTCLKDRQTLFNTISQLIDY
jgi:hypothetical protein